MTKPEREYTQADAMAYANKVHDALMAGARIPPANRPPMCLHSYLCFLNYRSNCHRLQVTPFCYERYMSLIYTD
jgi:hypothetical protein